MVETPVSPKGPIKTLSILGSSGSIGTSTLEVVRSHPERFRVAALAAGNNVGLLKEQIEEFAPRFVSVITEEAALRLRNELKGTAVEVGFGGEGAVRAATIEEADTVVSAISGAAGLVPTFEAVRAGKDVALANKETLVMAGPLVMEEARRRGARLLPVDSEHSAVFQALSGHRGEDVKRIILTASGGPFLDLPTDRLEGVTPGQALRHPRWSMGRKITVDSATLMNKGLEVIEARWLFDVPAEKISVYIHPQSIVHSMVEYLDGSIISQMGSIDMRGPIAYALSWPERIASGIPELELSGLFLEFSEPDPGRFPCLGLAYDALVMGGTAPAALNAADEVAVEMFLEGKIKFTDIYGIISRVLKRFTPVEADSIETILEADRLARRLARELTGPLTG